MDKDSVCTETELANKINDALFECYEGLYTRAIYHSGTEDVCVPPEDDEPIQVTTTPVTRQLRQISVSKASGPDCLPNWILKEYAEILAPAITDIINCSFRDSKVPQVWKIADVPPVPRVPTISDFNKDLRTFFPGLFP